jgi:hypothetical protein
MRCTGAAVNDHEWGAVADRHVIDEGAVAVDESFLRGEDVDFGVGLGEQRKCE